jgi:hypothetical protein
MKYQVPQFIDVEDKIFGPLTFKQFVYVIGATGMSFVIYKFVPLLLAIPIIAAVMAFGLALAFYKVNNKPFIVVVEAAIKYWGASKLYIWKKLQKKPEANTSVENTKSAEGLFVPKLSDSKLKDLTWSLDINETIYSKEAGKLTTRTQDDK